MSERYEYELSTPEAPWSEDEITVAFETLTFFEKIRFAGSMPTGVKEFAESTQPGDDVTIPSGMDEYVTLLIDTVSDFPPELYTELSSSTQQELLRAASRVLVDNDPTESIVDTGRESDSTYDPFDGFDLNDDGSLDPDEWR